MELDKLSRGQIRIDWTLNTAARVRGALCARSLIKARVPAATFDCHELGTKSRAFVLSCAQPRGARVPEKTFLPLAHEWRCASDIAPDRWPIKSKLASVNNAIAQ